MGSMLDKMKQRAEDLKLTVGGERELMIPLAKTRFDPEQPRQRYNVLDGQAAEDLAYIEELAQSIKEQGLIQPITVEDMGDGTYMVRVGECRTRAHLLLKRKEIRAKINNDLKTRNKRLLYQLAENITRNDLNDAEVASTIKSLMEGNPAQGEKPLNQTQIAARLGKSEGWITRFVAYGDDELRRLWVESGIADTAEKVYRLKLLPAHLQLDVLRRVALPADDPDALIKPIKRSVIDDYAQRAKFERNRQRISTAAPAAEPAAPRHTSGEIVQHDPVALALTELAAEQADTASEARQQSTAASPRGDGGGTGYMLPEEVRGEIMEKAGTVRAEAKATRDLAPAVNCRVQLANLEALLPALRTNPAVLKAVRRARVDLLLPGELAQEVATALVGVVVDEKQLAPTLQNALSKLK